MTEASVRKYLSTGEGISLCVCEELPSTNTLAREMGAAGAPHGTVIAAERQSAGRGRRGRSFFSPGGTGLYMSVLLRPEIPPEHAVRITTAAAAALCRALEGMGVGDCSVKWVNDILRGGRKIAGILTEAAFTGDGKMDYAVLGVGVNLTPPPGGFPEEIAHIAGTAFDAEIPDGRERLLAAFLAEFFALYGELSRPDAAYLAEYRRRCCVPGRRVTVLPLGGEPYEAFAEGIDEECRLIIRLPDGQKKVISTGEVSLRL